MYKWTKRRRPSRHIRNVRYGKGRRLKHRIVINPNISAIVLPKSRKNQDISTFKKIADGARNKGYNIPPIKIGDGPIQVENVDIPENFYIDGFTMPVEEALSSWNKRFARKHGGKYYIGVDDDAPHINRVKAFAHELGHVHMVQANMKPHTEEKADKIGADILSMPVNKFKQDMVFDMDFFKAGIQLPKRIPKNKLNRVNKNDK